MGHKEGEHVAGDEWLSNEVTSPPMDIVSKAQHDLCTYSGELTKSFPSNMEDIHKKSRDNRSRLQTLEEEQLELHLRAELLGGVSEVYKGYTEYHQDIESGKTRPDLNAVFQSGSVALYESQLFQGVDGRALNNKNCGAISEKVMDRIKQLLGEDLARLELPHVRVVIDEDHYWLEASAYWSEDSIQHSEIPDTRPTQEMDIPERDSSNPPRGFHEFAKKLFT